jgi:chromosome segregation ATPase
MSGTGPRGGPAPAGNVRGGPTATGEIMGLAPHETPLDRAVELARKIDLVNRENLALLARIRQLEAAAEARETALNETLRDVQNASDEVARTRTELQNVRKELAAVKARILQVEKDETETLKAIIAAIEKLLQQPMPPDNGSKK